MSRKLRVVPALPNFARPAKTANTTLITNKAKSQGLVAHLIYLRFTRVDAFSSRASCSFWGRLIYIICLLLHVPSPECPPLEQRASCSSEEEQPTRGRTRSQGLMAHLIYLPLCMRYQESMGSALGRGPLPISLYEISKKWGVRFWERIPYGRGSLPTSLYEILRK